MYAHDIYELRHFYFHLYDIFMVFLFSLIAVARTSANLSILVSLLKLEVSIHCFSQHWCFIDVLDWVAKAPSFNGWVGIFKIRNGYCVLVNAFNIIVEMVLLFSFLV